MEPTSCVLGGIVIAVFSSVAGKFIGSNGKVKDETCIERQHACSQVIITKVDNLTLIVNKLEKTINNKLLN